MADVGADHLRQLGHPLGGKAQLREHVAAQRRVDGKVVVIRGKVVKVTAGIMDKNWVHIQDGTGSSANGTYDLTCTTSDPLPAKDTVVTLTGTLARNRDFGAGYFYSVIVENASFSKK